MAKIYILQNALLALSFKNTLDDSFAGFAGNHRPKIKRGGGEGSKRSFATSPSPMADTVMQRTQVNGGAENGKNGRK